MPTNNITPDYRHLEQNLLMRCLARHVLREYPNRVKRQEFYDRWLARHGRDSHQQLLTLIQAEYASFEGWCALFSRSVSYMAMREYLDDTKSSLATPQDSVSHALFPQDAPFTERGFYVPPTSATPPPWWSELPHLAEPASHPVPNGGVTKTPKIPRSAFNQRYWRSSPEVAEEIFSSLSGGHYA